MAMSNWIPTTDLMLLRRFGKLSEELGELQAVAARCVIQGIDEIDPGSGRKNRQRLESEIADVLAQCCCTIAALSLNREIIDARVDEKIRQMGEWESLFRKPEA